MGEGSEGPWRAIDRLPGTGDGLSDGDGAGDCIRRGGLVTQERAATLTPSGLRRTRGAAPRALKAAWASDSLWKSMRRSAEGPTKDQTVQAPWGGTPRLDGLSVGVGLGAATTGSSGTMRSPVEFAKGVMRPPVEFAKGVRSVGRSGELSDERSGEETPTPNV